MDPCIQLLRYKHKIYWRAIVLKVELKFTLKSIILQKVIFKLIDQLKIIILIFYCSIINVYLFVFLFSDSNPKE